MRLSKLKLAGFKSFVDATTILTPGQLVGVVGPNGCGKSNVIDAVRWVLGESRASALRGESMQDVIFNGSTTRKPVSRASVELIFDNAQGKAAGQWSQYAEISVKRVVDRTGGSDYFINNVKVRRKDVIDLFLGTGLGPRAYAIIEQGMISRVIEARPEEVRSFLEEAAGITKYKERRRETEGRLSDARDNLARIEDISAELGAQIGRLSEQAEVARQYKGLHDELTSKQTLLWVFKREQALSQRDKAAEAITQGTASLERETAQLHTLEAQVAAAREGHSRLTEVVSTAQGDFYAITAEVSRVENELKNLRENRTRLTQRIEQLTQNETQWRERAAQLAEERTRWEDVQALSAQRLETAQESHLTAQDALPATESTFREAQGTLEQLRRDHAQAEQQARVELTKHQAGTRSLQALQQRRARFEQEHSALLAQPVESADELEMAAETIALNLEQTQADLATHQNALTQAQANLAAAQQAERTAHKQVTEKRARLDAARAMQAKLRDQGNVANWRKAAGLAELPPVWQSIQAQAGWELALEAVLRERLAAVGPAALSADLFAQPAPSTLVVLHQHYSEDIAAQPFAQGVPLAAQLRCTDSALEKTLKAWLANVYAVDSLAPWLDAGSVPPAGVTLVARNGALLTAHELTLFAPDANTHGAMERQREIETLSLDVETLEIEQEQRAQTVSEIEQSLAQMQNSLVESRRKQGELQQQLHSAQMEVLRVKQLRVRFDERSAQLQREAQEIAAQEEAEQQHLTQAEQGRDFHQDRAMDLLSRLDDAQRVLSEREQALNALRDKVQNLLRGVQEAEFSARECNSKLGDIARNEKLMTEQITQGETELAHLITERDGLDEETLQISLQTALDLRTAREGALTARREDMESAVQTMRRLDEERLRCEHALEPLREQVNALRMSHQAAELAYQAAVERLTEWQVANVTFPPEVLSEVRELALNRDVARLTREIAELGDVNLAALTELTSATERKQFLDAQYQDLMQAINTLEDAIRRIDRETREQLMATFNTVNQHFSELFPRLFGGGRAELLLTGDEILDAGVQIIAQPPGKKNTSIQLLSGGEKALTAIALVFSMFQLNPAPFCMLDEVDAPLDDSNTERYSALVKHMSASTQFIFISHSKITMEMAQQLVGVTMQEQGVSRVVEVDMEEALKLAEPSAT